MRARVLVVLAMMAALVAGSPARAAARAAGVPPIKHVFIIVLENRSFDETFGFNSAAHYLSLTLPSMGALVPNYYGVTHESLGNYIAMVSGQGANPLTQADCPTFLNVIPGSIGANGQAAGMGCVYPAAVKTIADQLSGSGRGWRGYMQDMANGSGQSKTCRHPAIGSSDKTQSARRGDEYAARHNPFVYFHSIIDSSACAQNDIPLDRLPGDLASPNRTPSYSFITPNLCQDAHDAKCVDGGVGGLSGANSFLMTWVPRILASKAYRADGLLAIIFDESSGSDASACCGEPQFPNTPNNGGPDIGRGGGRTGAVMLSPYIDPGTVDHVSYNHFSLLRSIEDLFGLGHLGFAATPGLQTLGSDLFTCYAPAPVRARHRRLAHGAEIKLAVIGRGVARRPKVEFKLWHPGRVTVWVSHSGRSRRLVHGRRLIACQLLKVPLPYLHGRVTVTARAFGGSERRTLTF